MVRTALALNLIDLGDLIDEYTLADCGNADGSFGEIEYGKLWNCCPGNEIGVIVFDNRSRHAVCARCLSNFRGETQELPTVNSDVPSRSAFFQAHYDMYRVQGVRVGTATEWAYRDTQDAYGQD